ncbi:MAG: FAD-dependent oxidoreductase [Actinobacteria bacterium]|nr:FAD-dependent oxidoreductase [Actinomycetota bacterium]
MERVRSRSLWLESCGDLTPRPALSGDTDCDVAIVGGGLTGLWTALHLRELQPDCRVVVVESEVCGFGASGRNGGWCSALFPTSLDRLAVLAGRDAAVAQHRAMIDTLDVVGTQVERLGIDCHWARGGTVTVATNPAHVARLRAHVEERRRWGFGESDDRWLSPAEMAQRVRVVGNAGGAFTPHCASVDPARLVRGLARAVESAGARIHEGTRATSLHPGGVTTDHGRLRADVVLRCTEGYTASMPGERRRLLPLYSMMIATEPLSAEIWEQIGLADRETFSDGRHLLVYGQRTLDGRFAFGGRGAPYHFGSAIRDAYDRDRRIADDLTSTLRSLFPPLVDARITHHWGGPLGVPRDWTASVRFDGRTGLGAAGGYVGDGVSTTNLAGRTLADLVLGRDTDLVRLPWVGHRCRDWEPEPLRWIGVNSGRTLAAATDRSEARRRRPSRLLEGVLQRVTDGH